MNKYIVVFEKSSTGYSAYAPDLPGCVAAGSTINETEKLMRGALKMHLEGMREDGDRIPTPAALAKVIDVSIPPAIPRRDAAPQRRSHRSRVK